MFVTTAYVLSATAVEGAVTSTEAEVHTETGVAHEANHADVFPPFDATQYPSQLLWLAITFGIFYLIVSKLITPRVGSIIETREARIAGDLAEAKRMKDEADAAVAKYEQELAAARAKAQGIAAEAREAAKAKNASERAKIEADLASKIADAEKSIAAIKNAALSEVSTVAEGAASEIVARLTGVDVNQAEAAQAVQAVKG